MELFEKVVAELTEVRKEILEAWASGRFTEESSDGTIQMNAKWIGKVEMLDEVIELIKEKSAEYDYE